MGHRLGLFLMLWVGIACEAGGQRAGGGSIGGTASLGGSYSGDPDAVALPFAVDDHFSATGFMGAAVSAFALVDDPNGCMPRPQAAQGKCHHLHSSGPGADGWTGLRWLSGPENWGGEPGLTVVAGARRVRFYAASKPAVSFRFLAGGVQGGPSYEDDFSVGLDVTTNAELVPYEIELTQTAHETGVLGAFGFSTDHPGEFDLYIDDIVWE